MSQIWPGIAEFFDLPLGEPQQIPLSDYMRDKGPVWKSIVEKYGLREDVEWDQLGIWTFAVS